MYDEGGHTSIVAWSRVFVWRPAGNPLRQSCDGEFQRWNFNFSILLMSRRIPSRFRSCVSHAIILCYRFRVFLQT